MLNQYENVLEITSTLLPTGDRLRRLNDFAHELGWRPSDQVDIPAAREFTTAHLLVEHGLEHTAVLSFIAQPYGYRDLSSDAVLKLHTISYNNLVDWHLTIERDAVNFIYVRTSVPEIVERKTLSKQNYDSLRSEAFERIIGRRPTPNIPALDDALIRTISFWKKSLFAELESQVSSSELAALFNALIFVRALEDSRRRRESHNADVLLDHWDRNPRSLRDVITSAARELADGSVPPYLLDSSQLRAFDGIEAASARALIADFYRNRFAPYPYDFSIMSQHALSRIYEHYVSILEEPTSEQMSFLPVLPKETIDRSQGSVYTPQFIARFFARYLRERLPPFLFKRIRAIDPACGSGIFLRSLLEVQCDPLRDGLSPAQTRELFQNVIGIDANDTAVQAARVSIALLHLVVLDSLPDELPITTRDALSFLEGISTGTTYDAVVCNPPFVAHDHLPLHVRTHVAEVLGDLGRGKNDLHLAFLKLAVDALRPGGVGLFVLPHSFLLGQHAAGLRSLLVDDCWILCLADLSSVRVFDDTGAYVILLIFQKRPTHEAPAPGVTVVRCNEFIGRALEDAVEGRYVQTPHYSVYAVPQEEFAHDDWAILPPGEAELRRRLTTLPPLSDFLDVRQGIITGADDVFIIADHAVPKGEEALYLPLLRDRDMSAYTVPRRTRWRVFFPFIDGHRVESQHLRRQYPATWAYLAKHRHRLESRTAIKRYRKEWWEPLWPRQQSVLRPKLVAPHLVVVPKFALDDRGKFGVTRAPMLLLRDEGGDLDLLKYFVAILNSTPCFWHITMHSHKYQRGYVMLEPKTLSRTPVPDPMRVSAAVRKRLIALVAKRSASEGPAAIDLERSIDDLVTDLYGLSAIERRAISDQS